MGLAEESAKTWQKRLEAARKARNSGDKNERASQARRDHRGTPVQGGRA